MEYVCMDTVGGTLFRQLKPDYIPTEYLIYVQCS